MRRYSDAPSPAAQQAPRQTPRWGRYRYVRLRWRLLFALVDALGRWLVGRRRSAAGDPRELHAAGADTDARPPDEPRSILLVQLDHLGDAVISLVLLPALRARYPQAAIEVLAGAWNSELFQACPEVDRVHVSRVNRFARRGGGWWMAGIVWWGWKLRARRFDWAIDVRGEFPLALLLWLTGARRRFGWNAGGGGFLLSDSPEFVAGRPEVLSRWALAERLGIPAPPTDTVPGPAFVPDAVSRQRIARELAGWGPSEAPWIVLHIGAGTEAKRWPVGHWRELVCRLLVERPVRIVLVGDGRDRKAAAQILAGVPEGAVFDACGRFGIVELAALLERAAVFLGADSGPAHLAAAVGTPVVALFSGTNDVTQWRPWGSDVEVLAHPVACAPCHRTTCAWADHPCMNLLSPALVARALMRRLDGGRGAQRLAGPPRVEPVPLALLAPDAGTALAGLPFVALEELSP